MLKIIFEDNHLLILNKPAGLLTQPTELSNDSLETEAKTFIKERDKKKGGVFLHAIHRLDKEVSGIVLFAKSQKALERLQASMRNKEYKKMYLALCDGKPAQHEGTLKHYLLHSSHKAKIVSYSTPEAKEAILHYKVLRVEEEISLLQIELETGRYHQIRVQLQEIGCPIVGDVKYGSKKKLKE